MDDLVDCEKVVLKRLDGIYEIRFVDARAVKAGGSVQWLDGFFGTHTGCLRNSNLLFEEYETEEKPRGLFR